MPHPSIDAALLRRCRLLVVGAVLALACGAGAGGLEEQGVEDVPLTLAECDELGGTPLFDPADERPTELSCPLGLRFIGEFEEDFYGAEGGICCADGAAGADDEPGSR